MTGYPGDYDEEESELAQRRLCYQCVGEAYLRGELKRDGKRRKCHYCGKRRPGLSIGEIGDYVERAFEEHFYLVSANSSAFEYAMMSATGERPGEPAAYAIAGAALVEQEPAEDIRELLYERLYDKELAEMIEDLPFADDSYYAGRDVDDVLFRESWRYFEESLKTEARFFSATAKATLDTVFANIDDHRKDDGAPVIVDAGPGTKLPHIHRGRVFHSIDKLEKALHHPEKGLGPPPPALGVAGRMNPRGIAVFYGAMSPEIAIGEVRPPVGSRVAVARFEFLERVRLLDVSALREVYVEGSIFEPGYRERLELAQFLERLSQRFAMPVMPDDEPLEYLPTQAIADYLSTQIDPPLDGIVYPSVQGDEDAGNIVLFQGSSRVEPIERPPYTSITVSSGHVTDENEDEHWRIWEEVPAHDPEPEKDEEAFSTFTSFEPVVDLDRDLRAITLRIDQSSIRIYRVTAARYTTICHKVHHHRRTGGSTPA